MNITINNACLQFQAQTSPNYLTPTDAIVTGTLANSNTTGNVVVEGGGQPIKFFDVSAYAGSTLNIKTVIRATSSAVQTDDYTIGAFFATAVTSASANESHIIINDMSDNKVLKWSGLSKTAGYNGSNSNWVVEGTINIPSGAVTLALCASGTSSLGTDPSADMQAYVS